MRMNHSLLPVAAVAALGALNLPTAEATGLFFTTNQLIDASDTIVRGTVTEVWTERDETTGYTWTHAQVEVSTVLKGEESELLIIQQPGGEWGGTITSVSFPTARFSVGEDAYFFVEHLASGRSVPVGAHQGKFNTQMDPYDQQLIVYRYQVPEATVFDHRFIPLPPADQRVNIAEFEERVLSRVEAGWDGEPIPGINTEKLFRINNLQDGIR